MRRQLSGSLACKHHITASTQRTCKINNKQLITIGLVATSPLTLADEGMEILDPAQVSALHELQQTLDQVGSKKAAAERDSGDPIPGPRK